MTRSGRFTLLLLLPVAFQLGAGAQAADAAHPGLEAHAAQGEFLGFCALKDTRVKAAISGPIAEVEVVQVFENTLLQPIEAVYTFPLPEDSAVHSFELVVANRRIQGEIHEREAARRLYQAAMHAGKRAGLLDQERPNIFTTSVANVMPGEQVEVKLSYLQLLRYEDAAYEFVFPMIVGPRYIPGGDQVPDAARVFPQYVSSERRPANHISLSVEISAGLPIQWIKSDQHEIRTVYSANRSRAQVALVSSQVVPDRDFILRYAVAGEEIRDSVLSYYRGGEGYFSLVLYPPARARTDQVRPKEMIFVIDCSGSMSGFPLEKAKETMRLCVENMHPNDTFNLISFAGGQGYCFDKPVDNTPENRASALAYLQGLEGGGGTEMMGAVRAALGGAASAERLRIVCFMTDGYVGNDLAILEEVQRTAGEARLFSFGIGSSVNRFLLENMARVGRGASEIVTLEAKGAAAAKRFYERMHSPVLTDIHVRFEGVEVSDVQPAAEQMPDLFSESPLVLTGRYSHSDFGTAIIRGTSAAGAYERRVPLELRRWSRKHDALMPLWARMRIGQLMSQDYGGLQSGTPNPEIRSAITELGLAYRLATPFTSFVAVDEVAVNRGRKALRTAVPLGMPAGVSYEGIFGASVPQAIPVVSREIAVFNNVLFAAGSSSLDDQARMEIDKIIAELKSNPNDLVVVEGHTDAIGEDAANMALGQRRADAVRDYMVQQGIAPGRITTLSFGESQPVVPNDTERNRKLNRRVVFKISIR